MFSCATQIGFVVRMVKKMEWKKGQLERMSRFFMVSFKREYRLLCCSFEI